LTRNTKTVGFLIKRLDHPNREIYIHALDFEARASGRASIKMRRHIRARVM
jgi:hypothetical protein